MRIMLPGWYGLGSALNSENIQILQEMYEKWDFFRTQLSNVDMLLSKTDFEIAKEYIKLANNKEVAKKIYDDIKEELELTKNLILKISKKSVLLEDNKELAQSLQNRMPYFNALNYLQIELIKRVRAGNDSEYLKKQFILV